MSIDVNVQNDLVIVTETTEDIVVNVSNAAGPQGPAGAAGVGVPVGGTTGQVLKKFTNTNYDTYWAADASGLTSVGLSVPTGLTVTNSPLTTNGTIAVGLASGYSIPTTASQATWNTSYNDSIVSAGVTGTTTKTLTLNQQDGGTVTASWSDLNTDAVTSVFGRTGAVVATEGDYTLTQLGDVTLTSPTNGQVLKYNGTTWVNNTDTDTGLTSVGLSMPSAFAVSNSPLTSNGTIAVTGAGIATQYIRGDGQLATFPSTASGGSSVNYYLNGSVNSSVAGYQQLDNSAIIGGGTDFTLSGNGLIAQFLTDVGNPNRVQIPGGAWNFEMYFSSSSNGGSEGFYVELLKYNGTTFTSIASSSTNPEQITGGTSTDLYLTSLAVPTTALLVTDRLAIRVYIVNNAAARTVTLKTEDNNLCEIITTFAGGVSSLNGLTANTQYLATGTMGSDFNINSVTDTHTFNLPIASGTNTGKLSNTDWTTFNSKQNAITLTTTGTSGASTLVGSTLNIPQYADQFVGTVTSVSALTLGTTGTDLSSTVANGTTTPVITLNVPTASATNRGVLSSADWTTFNNKQNALTNPVTGTGTTNYLPKWTSGSAIGNSIITDSGSIVTIGGALTVSVANINLSNNYNLTGRNAANTLNLPLIGRNGSDRIDIDVDSYGTTIGGTGTIVLNATGGNVGIGTASPAYKLDVNRSSLGAIAQFITLDGTYNPRLLINGTSEGIQLFATYSSGAEALMFGTANTERMRLTSNLIIGSTTDNGNRLQVTGNGYFNGSVGIGVSPSCSLHIEKASQDNILAVIGQSGYEGSLFLSGAGSGKDANIVVGNGKDLQFHTSLSATPVVDGTLRLTIASTGAATFSSSVTATSFIKSGGTSSQYLMADGSTSTLTNPVTGTGTTTRLPIWTSSTALGNSGILDNGTSVTLDSRALIGTSATFTGNMNADDYNMAAWKILDWNGVVAQIGGISANEWTQLEFFTSGTSKMTLTSGGNLLVGSSVDSGERLQISGTMKVTGAATFSSDVTVSGVLQETVTTNRQTASYTLALTDRGKLVEMNVATANNLTVPLNSSVAFAIGTKIDLAQYGAGQTTVVATSGVTVRSAGGALKLAVQYSGASLVKIGTNEWYLFGDITV